MMARAYAQRALAPAVIAFGLVTLFAGSADAKEGLIGYVNLQKAIVNVQEGKRAKEALRKTFEKKKLQIKKREEGLKTLLEDIQKQQGVASEALLREKQMKFQKLRFELQEQLLKEQKELQALEQKELAGITKKLRGVVDAIGKKGGYTLILELQDARLLYAKDHLDLTNEVIRKYDQRYK